MCIRDSHSDAPGPRDALGRPNLLLAYAHMELTTSGRPRVVSVNEDFVALVPFWATWPFEILLLPHRRFIPSVQDLSHSEIHTFATILGEITCRYDNLFQTSFPYSMGLHQRPVLSASDQESESALLHIHFYPPLLRSATVRKFLVG